MGCENCTQKQKDENAKKSKIVEMAQEEANETGEWFAIYNKGQEFIRADLAIGIPVEQYVSPKRQDSIVL